MGNGDDFDERRVSSRIFASSSPRTAPAVDDRVADLMKMKEENDAIIPGRGGAALY